MIHMTPQIPGIFFFFFLSLYKFVATENPYRAPFSCRDNPDRARSSLLCARIERYHLAPRPCRANFVANRLYHVVTRSPCQDPNSVTRSANDASRARVQLSSTRTRKLESEFESSSKARELEK